MDIEDPNKNRGKGKGKGGGNRPGKYVYTEEELLDKLKCYREEYGKIPSKSDFERKSNYPHFSTYQERFGSWTNALKLVGLDADSAVKEGNLLNNYHKARLAELLVFNSFKEKNKAVDLSGKNYCSIFDGICPRGLSYDVKIASFRRGGYSYNLRNKEFERIEYFYLVAVNKEYTELYYIWLIPRKELRLTNGSLYISTKNLLWYDKYLVDLSKCNLDFLNNNCVKED